MVNIRRLSPDELEPFLAFMDGPAFKAQPQWAGCHCQHYLNTVEQNADPASKQGLNRERACDRINAGTMQGYLAFEGDGVIGWVAANKANNFIALPPTADSVARILCFVVAEEHQGKGIARAMLNFALDDLTARGFTAVEAAPQASGVFAANGYRGPLSMFLKAGFSEGPMVDDQHILVTKELTGNAQPNV